MNLYGASLSTAAFPIQRLRQETEPVVRGRERGYSQEENTEVRPTQSIRLRAEIEIDRLAHQQDKDRSAQRDRSDHKVISIRQTV